MTRKLDKLPGGSIAIPAPSQRSQRLDADVSAFYSQQLQYIAPQAFDVKRAPLLARQFVPAIAGVPEWADVYKFRGHELVGSAKLATGKANTPPRGDVIGHEAYQTIISRFSSFVYSYEEIRKAQATGIPLDAYKMQAAVRAVEQQMDKDLSIGDADLGLKGILRAGTGASANTGCTTVSPGNKTGGGTAWSTLATGEELADDVVALINKIAENNEDDATRFGIVMPRAKLQLLSRKTIGVSDGRTVLTWLQETQDQIAFVRPWSRCLLAGGSSNATRMAAIPQDPMMVGALVPREASLGNMVEGLMETEQVVLSRCGGVVPYYPLMIGYMDAI